MSSVKSTISKLEKDAVKCYDNTEKPDVDMATILSKGNPFRKSIKEKKEVEKSKEREKKVNMQVVKDR